jgi:hypothetical protein
MNRHPRGALISRFAPRLVPWSYRQRRTCMLAGRNTHRCYPTAKPSGHPFVHPVLKKGCHKGTNSRDKAHVGEKLEQKNPIHRVSFRDDQSPGSSRPLPMLKKKKTNTELTDSPCRHAVALRLGIVVETSSPKNALLCGHTNVGMRGDKRVANTLGH